MDSAIDPGIVLGLAIVATRRVQSLSCVASRWQEGAGDRAAIFSVQTCGFCQKCAFLLNQKKIRVS